MNGGSKGEVGAKEPGRQVGFAQSLWLGTRQHFFEETKHRHDFAWCFGDEN
jgi:hypothetical protein